MDGRKTPPSPELSVIQKIEELTALANVNMAGLLNLLTAVTELSEPISEVGVPVSKDMETRIDYLMAVLLRTNTLVGKVSGKLIGFQGTMSPRAYKEIV